MIDIQVPSYDRIDLLKRFVASYEKFMLPYGFTLTLNLDYVRGTIEYAEAEEILHRYKGFIQEPLKTRKKNDLFLHGIRRRMHLLNIGKPWLLFDDDDQFVKGSAKFYLECYQAMKEIKRLTGRPSFCGTAGWFGSNHKGKMIHISKSNPIMPKGHGLLFHEDINFSDKFFASIDKLNGGAEELAFCSMALKYCNAIPLKRFRCPSKIKFRNAKQRLESGIHNQKVWNKNSFQYIRELSGNPEWIYPIDMKHKGKNVSKCPKNFFKKVNEICKDEKLQKFI